MIMCECIYYYFSFQSFVIENEDLVRAGTINELQVR